ncbi:CheR family methyltransferase [Noviherbaspirillum sedimenti]|uniref:protein-glutamate O-methyltransferase n=1 Tax=Noviherbaspirillum sedimenti TaxID=2320865 RepID=A0A3A3G5K3_9BURK|nr:protein-glutamate O-methyltransferase CheR [Noviherbaspirillum sedimenti]RJG03787.1 protein-glutamate O-methyltransferase CheR [Noviherbaspirillum sedimenti]
MQAAADIDAATLTALIQLVRKHTGMAMTEKKSILLQGRLRPRLLALSLGSYRDYLHVVEKDLDEVQLFINMVTTNDTLFFRTPLVWDFFSVQFLPEWQRDHAGQTLRIWSAAAASGEEAYSIAMLCEEFRQHAADFQYQILATDISTETLAAAREGLYRGRSLDKIKASQPRLLEKYFYPHEDGRRIAAELKNRIRFAEHNLLCQLQTPARFDIVFLRNVLIYFDAQSQERIVNLVRGVMSDDARLILGESESLSRLTTPFQFEKSQIYRVDPVLA